MIYESPYNERFSYPNVDIAGLILDHNVNGDSPTKPAIIDGYTGKTVYTYASLRSSIAKFGGFLQQDVLVGKDDIVAYLSFNTTYYPIIVHGIIAAGATVSAFNPAYQPEETAHSLKLAKPRIVLVQVDLLDNLEAALALLPKDFPRPAIHLLGGERPQYKCHNVEQILEQSPSPFRLQRVHRSQEQISQDVAFICFSSGTSGLVKGVRLTHRNIVANVFQQACCLRSMFTPESVFTLIVPFYHILGLAGFCVQYVSQGAPIVVFRKFELSSFFESIRRDRVTHINVVPPIALAISQSPLTEKADFSSVRCLMNAAAPLKQNLADALCQKLDCVLTQWYGMTEASPSVISQRESEAHIPDTIGRLLPRVQLRIVDPDFRDVPPGQPGELIIRGPNIMQSYVGPPELMTSAMVDGFFRTGDVGYIDEKGFIFLVDRLKELIKVKGHQVAPAELEALLLSHPSVTDAAVCGVYLEEEATEYPMAYITTQQPKSAHEKTAKDVQRFVDGQVAQYKRLRGGVHILDAIPRNPSGKILRRRLPGKVDPATAAALLKQLRAKSSSKL